MPRHKLHSSLALAGVVAAMRITKAALGFGGGGDGLLDAAFSAADAPNGPSVGPTGLGSGGAGSGPNSPSDSSDDNGAPDGFDNWLDFLDWATWTTVKNLLRAPIGFAIEGIEAAPTTYDTLTKVKDHNQRLRDSIQTDYRGTSHLTGGQR
jgi:hypothetical protein